MDELSREDGLPLTEQLRGFFAEAFGNDPYPFQVEVMKRLLQGTNVVLLAPTGSGKTRPPLGAFAFARKYGIPFADRLIYALPQRTLAMALHSTVSQALERFAPELKVTIQTGAMPDDEFLEGEVIFTTIDQLLSAYIEVPVSLRPRLANIPGASILGSLVVFDEFHLLEPGRALATALDLAARLNPYTRTLLMSATFPAAALGEVVRRAKAVSITVPQEEAARIPSQRDKKRIYRWHGEPLTAQAILSEHRDRSIVVVNRVDRAQGLYRETLAATKYDPSIRVLLLHSRFRSADRTRIEAQVIEHFKQGGLGRTILIATSVIEVGLDISCENLHTEVSTGSSLFQRAGRCARYAGESGTVHVYDLEISNGHRRYGPYRPDSSIVDAVATQMEARDGRPLSFQQEQEVVSATHGHTELARLSEAEQRSRTVRVDEARRTHEGSFVRELVREVDSVSLLIHCAPETLDLDARPETFSLPRSVLMQCIRALDLSGAHAGMVRYPVYPDTEGYPQPPHWEGLADPGHAMRHFLICLHPTLASYDDTEGLVLLPPVPGSYESSPTTTDQGGRSTRYSYHKEPFSEHARRVAAQTEVILAQHGVALRRLAEGIGTTPASLGELLVLASLLHDTGKLSQGVQDAMWRWMKDVHGDPGSEFLAHTTYDPSDSRQATLNRDARFRRPPHAAEGAYAVSAILAAAVKRLNLPSSVGPKIVQALLTSVARHHSASTSTLSMFKLQHGASVEVGRLIASHGLPLAARDKPTDVDRSLFPLHLSDPAVSEPFYLLYLFAARVLRLADQRGTARKE